MNKELTIKETAEMLGYSVEFFKHGPLSSYLLTKDGKQIGIDKLSGQHRGFYTVSFGCRVSIPGLVTWLYDLGPNSELPGDAERRYVCISDEQSMTRKRYTRDEVDLIIASFEMYAR